MLPSDASDTGMTQAVIVTWDWTSLSGKPEETRPPEQHQVGPPDNT